MRYFAGIARDRTWVPGFRSWPPTSDTYRSLLLTTTCSSSSHFERLPANALPITTKNCYRHQVQRKGADEIQNIQSARAGSPRLLCGSPSTPSRLEPQHHSELPG